MIDICVFCEKPIKDELPYYDRDVGHYHLKCFDLVCLIKEYPEKVRALLAEASNEI